MSQGEPLHDNASREAHLSAIEEKRASMNRKSADENRNHFYG